jgi:hypothetical protein
MGGLAGGGGSKTDWSTVAYNNAYTAAQQGQDWQTVQQHTDPNYLDPAYAGYQAGVPRESGGISISLPAMPSSNSSQLALMMEKQAAEAEEARLAAERLERR